MDHKVKIYLREWLRSVGLTGEELADRLGTSKSVVSRLVNNRQQFSMKWLEMISQELEIDPVDLFRLPDGTIPKQPHNKYSKQAIINAVRELSNEGVLAPNDDGDSVVIAFLQLLDDHETRLKGESNPIEILKKGKLSS